MGSRSPVVEKLAAIPPFWRLVFSLIVAGTLLGVWLFAFVDNMLVSGKDLPVALHSPLDADYSADAVAFIPAARINLLSDAISDQTNKGNDAAEQVATIVNQMRTPVFTVTPYPGMTPMPATQVSTTAAPVIQEQTVVSPSQTIAAPTSTASAAATATIFVPTATVTATVSSYFPTRASPATTAPTKTPIPTYPPVFASPTNTTAPTSVPATQTPVPQQHTQTPVPPTNTAVPDPYPPPDYP